MFKYFTRSASFALKQKTELKCFFFLISIGLSQIVFSQTILTEREAILSALQNNLQMRVAIGKIEKQKSLKNTTISIYDPEILFESPTGTEMRPGILQRFDFPTVYSRQFKIQKNAIKAAESEKDITSNSLIFNVRYTYNELNFLIQKYNTLRRQDSIFSDILDINLLRYQVGQISNLEKINGEAYYKQIQFNLLQTNASLQNSKIQLSILIGRPQDTTIISDGKLTKIEGYTINSIPDTTFEHNPLTSYYNKQVKISEQSLKLHQSRRWPDLIVGYLNQTEPDASLRYRLRFGMTLPLWYWTYSSKIKAAKKDIEIVKNQARLVNYDLKGEYSKELAQFKQYETAVNYFETIGLQLSNEIIKSSRESYRLGSISYYFYLQNINQAFQIQLNYLEALRNYNQSIITLQYLEGDYFVR